MSENVNEINESVDNDSTSAPIEPTESNDIEVLQQELDKTKDQWLRAVAELENVRRRLTKEKEDALKFGTTSFARDMLSVLDNIQRAQSTLPVELPDNLKAIQDGIVMVAKEVSTIFERQGINLIDISVGSPFDPNFHQAVFEAPHDTIAPGHVIQVAQPGFTLHDRLLRPAMVGVSK